MTVLYHNFSYIWFARVALTSGVCVVRRLR